MKFCIHKGSHVRPHDQLRGQVLFLISTGSLAIGEEMPSVRGLARQLGIAANTVSKVYSELVREGWLLARPGAHHRVVWRREVDAVKAERPVDLDRVVNRSIRLAGAHGYSAEQLADRLRERLSEPRPDHLLLVHPGVTTPTVKNRTLVRRETGKE